MYLLLSRESKNHVLHVMRYPNGTGEILTPLTLACFKLSLSDMSTWSLGRRIYMDLPSKIRGLSDSLRLKRLLLIREIFVLILFGRLCEALLGQLGEQNPLCQTNILYVFYIVNWMVFIPNIGDDSHKRLDEKTH